MLLYEMLCARLPFVPPTQRPTKGKKGKDGKMGPGTATFTSLRLSHTHLWRTIDFEAPSVTEHISIDYGVVYDNI